MKICKCLHIIYNKRGEKVPVLCVLYHLSVRYNFYVYYANQLMRIIIVIIRANQSHRHSIQNLYVSSSSNGAAAITIISYSTNTIGIPCRNLTTNVIEFKWKSTNKMHTHVFWLQSVDVRWSWIKCIHVLYTHEWNWRFFLASLYTLCTIYESLVAIQIAKTYNMYVV